MTIDFHTHAKLANALPYSQEYMEYILRSAKQSGLDAICLTEHYYSRELDSVYRYIQDSLEKTGDCYLFDGLKIFISIEINIAESGHIVVIGSMDEIVSIYNELLERGKKKDHLPFAELLKVIKRPSLLIGAAHPFRTDERCILKLSEDQISQLDYVELSGKDCAHNRESIISKTFDLGNRLNMPVLGGSDTHQSFQYGCIFTRFEESHITVSGLKEAVAKRAFTVEHSDFAERQVLMAAKMKKALQKVYDLGGDYVSVLVH